MDAQARPTPEKNLRSLPISMDEEKEISRQRIASKTLRDQIAKPVKASAQVDGILESGVDPISWTPDP